MTGRPATPEFEVLLVDHDPATVATVRESVRELASVRHAPDAYHAVYDLMTHPVDAVVVELFLRGASGVDLLLRMRAKGLRVPSIVLTRAIRSYPELGVLGVRCVLHKPASPDLLLEALTKVLVPAPRAEPAVRTDPAAA